MLGFSLIFIHNFIKVHFSDIISKDYFLFCLLFIFFPSLVIPPYPLALPYRNYHTVFLSMSCFSLFFSFQLNRPTFPTISPHQNCVPALYLWVCLCFASSSHLFIRFLVPLPKDPHREQRSSLGKSRCLQTWASGQAPYFRELQSLPVPCNIGFT